MTKSKEKILDDLGKATQLVLGPKRTAAQHAVHLKALADVFMEAENAGIRGCEIFDRVNITYLTLQVNTSKNKPI